MSDPVVARLVVAVAGEPWTTLPAPEDFGARAWLLGVVAVQAFWSPGEGLTARVRAHRTGDGQARERPIGPHEPVTIRIVAGADEAGAGDPAAVEADAGPPSMSAFRGGALVARADLPDSAGTSLRAFGHVFVRWKREGDAETGFDLTGFSPPGSAEMYGRLRSEALATGVPVTYLVDWGHEPDGAP